MLAAGELPMPHHHQALLLYGQTQSTHRPRAALDRLLPCRVPCCASWLLYLRAHCQMFRRQLAPLLLHLLRLQGG
jgi:hypothetical protein